VAGAARAAGALVLGFVTTPLQCEASRRAKQAQQGLERLQAAADGVVCLANEKILKLIDENTSLLDTFKISNELLADGLRGVWQLLNYNGLIEIHFDDVRDLLRAGRAENFFATAEAAGPNRTREVVEKLTAHPLLDGGRALAAAQSALVSIVGGPGLSLAEVNRVMEQINRQCEGAQVLMGAAIDAAFADRLSVTVIAARGAAGKGEAGPAPELDTEFLRPAEMVKPASRFVPPPPSLTAEKLEELAGKKSGSRTRKSSSRMKQEQLPLEIISKGRFDKSEPTIRNGEDLDQPTFIRRGMVLN
jgi:cell division protein FtsZ